MIDIAALVLFPILMAYSALSDLFTMTISNKISLLLVVGFVILALAAGMPLAEIGLDHLACGAAVLMLTFSLFAFGWIGGGDAKLAASTAVWLGWTNLGDYGLLASILGAVLTIAIVRLRRRELPGALMRKTWIARLHKHGNGVPYGVALAVAGLVIYPDSSLWQTIVGA